MVTYMYSYLIDVLGESPPSVRGCRKAYIPLPRRTSDFLISYEMRIATFACIWHIIETHDRHMINILTNTRKKSEYIFHFRTSEHLKPPPPPLPRPVLSVFFRGSDGLLLQQRKLVAEELFHTKNLRINWEYFQAQSPNFLIIIQAQKILSDSCIQKYTSKFPAQVSAKTFANFYIYRPFIVD